MTHPSYLPPELARQVARDLPDTLNGDERWALERLVERAFSDGYAEGHLRGYEFGRAEEARSRRAATGPLPKAVDVPGSFPALTRPEPPAHELVADPAFADLNSWTPPEDPR